MRISKKGFSVLDKTLPKKTIIDSTPEHVENAIANTYLLGANKQLIRYLEAIATYKKQPIICTYHCLHESSSLFEDLATIAIYFKKHDHNNNLHKLLIDIRNHIRHDVREEFDKESSYRKNERAKRLNIDPTLQTNIEFDIDGIKVGEIKITIKEISDYLIWAGNILSKSFKEAKEKGQIK